LDFDFAPARYLQIGDNKPGAGFSDTDTAVYIVGGSNANSKLLFYRGATEAGRIESQGQALVTVVGSTKTYIDNTYYRIYNSVLIVSTGSGTVATTTPAIYVSSSLGNVGMGTAVMDPNHRLTVNGNIRLSTGSLIFSDGTSMGSANGGLSVGGVSNSNDAIVWSNTDNTGPGNVILQAGPLRVLVADTSGNVGIGTLSPISRLNVRGGDLVVGAAVSNDDYLLNDEDDIIVAGNLVVGQGIIQRSATPVQFTALNVSGDVFLSTAAGANTRVGSDVASIHRLDVNGDINASGVLRTNGTQRISAGGVLTNSTWNGSTIGVPYGGTGATSLTSGGILYGNGAGTIGALAVMTNGQLLIGNGSGAPTAATLTQASANQVVITNGAGSITLSLPQNIHTGASPTFNGLTLTSLTAGTGSFSGSVNMNNTGKIYNLVTPTSNADAANKSYVDGRTGGTGRGAWGLSGNNIGSGDFLGTTGADDLILKTNDSTRMTITSGGTIKVAAFSSAGIVKTTAAGILSGGSAVALGAEVSGTLPVGNGGTGATTLTSGGILYGNATGTIGALAVMTNGQLLIGNGSGAPTAATLTQASANQVVITNGAGSIALSLPQNIHAGASPTFTGLTLTGLTGVLKGAGSGAISVMTGTANTMTKWTDAYTIGNSVITDNGNVGISVAPTVGIKLDVNGKLRTTYFQMTDGASNNFVLASDGSGNASWVNPAGGGLGDPFVGNEITDAANATLTRSGGGTVGDNYKLALNLGNANTWTSVQTFSGGLTGNLTGNSSGSAGTLAATLSAGNSAVAAINLADTGTIPVARGGTGGIDAAAARTSLSAAKSGVNSDITSLTGVTTPLPVASGGTNAATAAAARTSLGAAKSGANSDITSLTALSTALSVAQGGTGGIDAAAARTSLGAAKSGVNSDITSLTAVTTPLPVASGGTNAATAAAARTSLGAAKSGVNSDITSLTAVTTPLPVASGGTGRATLTSGDVLVGNAAGMVTLVSGVALITFDVATTTTTPAQCKELTITNGIITAVGSNHNCD
jgi:hypothetical protein